MTTKKVRSAASCHIYNAVTIMYFSVSLTEALFSCTSMCLVLSIFNLIFVMMMKPLEVLSNCIWAVWAHAVAAVCLILTKPMKIISKTTKALWGCLKRPVHITEASTSNKTKGSLQRKGETLSVAFPVSLVEVLCALLCFVASFFSLLLEIMTKPFKLLSNCFRQSVWARVVLIFQMVTKPMEIVTNTIHIISSRTKPEPSEQCDHKKGEISSWL